MSSYALSASVIIPTHKPSPHMSEVIRQLRLQTFDPDRYEIIVVDNSPSGVLRDIVTASQGVRGSEVRYETEPRIGAHYARHCGAKVAKGEILVYVDDDVLVTEGWLSALMQEFQDPRVGIAGGKVSLQFELDPPGWMKKLERLLAKLDLGEDAFDVTPPGYVVSANLAIRRSLLYEVGGMNPGVMGGRDSEMIWLEGDEEGGLVRKVQKAGWIVRYTPEALVYHQIPASRCKLEFMLTRVMASAIENSFYNFRYFGITPYRTVRYVLGRLKDYTLALGPGPLRRLMRKYQVTCLAYVVRMLRSPSMRLHIQKETYLEKQDWPDA